MNTFWASISSRSNGFLLLLAAILFAVPLRSAAQSAETPPAQAAPANPAPVPTIKTESRLVLVDAVVTDKKGNYIHDLTQADFKVFEDGVEQKITAFTVESSGFVEIAGVKGEPTHPVQTAAASPAAKAPVRRTYMICIDTLHASFHTFVAAREALVKLFE